MADSILNSTKTILGVAEDYDPFDLAIITHINSALASLSQIGVGPIGGFFIEDAEPTWEDLGLSTKMTAMARTYIFLKVKMLFDPPATSFVIDAAERQIAEHEWRLAHFAEELNPLPVPMPVRPGRPNYNSEGEYVLVPLDDVMEGGY